MEAVDEGSLLKEKLEVMQQLLNDQKLNNKASKELISGEMSKEAGKLERWETDSASGKSNLGSNGPSNVTEEIGQQILSKRDEAIRLGKITKAKGKK